MSSPPGSNPGISQIPKPMADVGSLVNSTESLKQAVDTLAGFRGDQLGRAVTFNDLVKLGLVDKLAIKAPTGTSTFGSQITGSLGGYSSQAHTWSALQTYNSSNGVSFLFYTGPTVAGKFFPSASGFTIQGRNPADNAYQPIIVDASEVDLSLNGTTNYTFKTSGFTSALAVTFNAGLTVTGAGEVVGAPTGGDKGAGSVNAQNLYINGTALQTVETNSQTASANPVGTLSGAGVMMGLAGAITPSRSGVVHIIVVGTGQHSNSGGSFNVQIRTGTGAAPGNGAALTGNAAGPKISGNTAATNQKLPFTCAAIVSGLAIGTPVWIDVSLDDGGAGTATISNTSIVAHEL